MLGHEDSMGWGVLEGEAMGVGGSWGRDRSKPGRRQLVTEWITVGANETL